MRDLLGKRRLAAGILILVLGAFSVSLLATESAVGQHQSRTFKFKATYSGTLTVGPSRGIGVRRGAGNGSVIGKSTLVATDQVDRNPRIDPEAKCLAVVGDGVLAASNGDHIKFLFLLGGCPFGKLPSGYYFVYGGTGRFAGAHGQGKLRENGSFGAPGQTVSVTDKFTGTLSLP